MRSLPELAVAHAEAPVIEQVLDHVPETQHGEHHRPGDRPPAAPHPSSSGPRNAKARASASRLQPTPRRARNSPPGITVVIVVSSPPAQSAWRAAGRAVCPAPESRVYLRLPRGRRSAVYRATGPLPTVITHERHRNPRARQAVPPHVGAAGLHARHPRRPHRRPRRPERRGQDHAAHHLRRPDQGDRRRHHHARPRARRIPGGARPDRLRRAGRAAVPEPAGHRHAPRRPQPEPPVGPGVRPGAPGPAGHPAAADASASCPAGRRPSSRSRSRWRATPPCSFSTNRSPRSTRWPGTTS